MLVFTLHVMWGVFPLYFYHLQPASSLEVIVHRCFFALIFCLLVLAIKGDLAQLKTVFTDKTLFLPLSAAGVVILVNWTTYVYAVQHDRTIDASLGYFTTPLFTVFLAQVLLKEKLSRLQKLALGLGCVAVGVLILGMGYIPWVSVVLPISFGIYSYVKKDIAHRVTPVTGMVVETMVLMPFLLVYYGYLLVEKQTSFHHLAKDSALSSDYIIHTLLLVGAGILTAIPLIMMASAAQVLPLRILGMFQYLSPTIQLLIGVLVFHEEVEAARWLGQGIVWVAIVILVYDGFVQHRRAGRLLERLEN